VSDIYRVWLIHRGREKDYFDFSRRGRRSGADGKPLQAAELGFELRLPAPGPEQAIAAARRKHPGLQVDVERVERLDADG